MPLRSIATVLFTDIVGSTERAAALGDRRWRGVLAQHHAHVRAQLARFGGHEIATAGDGFLAVFESPARAILCADAIRGAIEELGLSVRCGLHLGEVERSDGTVGGIAVHIGARVAALAGANEILVSSTVRDAEAGSDFEFEDRGEHELKGMPGQWRLFAVTALPDDVEAMLHEPAGLQPAPDLWNRLRRSRVALAVIAFALLFGLAGLYVVIKDRGRSFSPDEALAEAGPGIAVLPFQTTGPGLDIWREGVIDLLSTNLDGAGGLRAIDSRTVLARWSETVADSALADLATSLEAARRMGARYAVVGAAVGIGSQVRLSADVYEVSGGRSLGKVQVEGAPDSVYMLVDRLAVDVLRTVLGSEAANLPRMELARTTTTSLPALRAYLEGELYYRRAEIPEAIEAYRRAVEADTTFALAYKRLAETIGWLPLETRPEQGVGYYADRANRYVDRLPEREAILVRGHDSFLEGSTVMLEPLKQATHRFPDDPELWYLVQEFYAHFDEQLLLPDDEKRRAFDRLLAMDPTFAPFYQHPIEDAFQEADSARTTTLLSRYAQLVESNSPELRSHRMAHDVAWGGPERRARALAAADTTDPTRLPALELLHPRFLADGEAIAEKGREGRPHVYSRAAAYRGRLQAALSVPAGPDPFITRAYVAFAAYTLRDHGAPEVDGFRRAIPSVMDTLGAADFWIGAVAAEEGRWELYDQILANANAFADTAHAEGDTLFEATVRGAVRALEAHADLQRGGDRETALRELVAAQKEATGWGPATLINRTIRWWIVRLLLDLDRPREAEPYLLSLDEDPYAHLVLGRIYEQLGETAQARERYELFVTAWQDAEPELQPVVAEARQALTRLIRPRG